MNLTDCRQSTRSGSWARPAVLIRATVGGVMLFLAATACTERNPDYDPLAFCTPGERRCLDQRISLICQQGGGWPDLDAGAQWVVSCWDETECSSGVCVPDEQAAARPCTVPADCDADRVCTVIIDPNDHENLGTYCILSPYDNGRESGVGCNSPEECKTGRCTRGVCYGACAEASDCLAAHECSPLDMTIDGVRVSGAAKGCVPPSP